MSAGRKTCFVFCHGFGFDATFWEPLRPYFSEMNTIYLDSGYFGAPLSLQNPDCEPTDFIGVGHSLGLMKLMSMSLNIDFKYFIGLHGFVNFLGFDEQLHRRRNRELMHLTRHFSHSPEATLLQFYQRTGVALDLSQKHTFNQIKLSNDLASLAHAVSIPKDVPMLILGSNDDKITPPELIEDNFSHLSQVTVHIINQAQHGLGHLKPDVVYDKIRFFLGYE